MSNSAAEKFPNSNIHSHSNVHFLNFAGFFTISEILKWVNIIKALARQLSAYIFLDKYADIYIYIVQTWIYVTSHQNHGGREKGLEAGGMKRDLSAEFIAHTDAAIPRSLHQLSIRIHGSSGG